MSPPEMMDNAQQEARAFGLTYVHDSDPGFERRSYRNGFRYFNSEGLVIKDQALLERFRALAIPPAWTRVWICQFPKGHLQATGYDSRGRKQYRYHPDWRKARDQAKFDHLPEVAAHLPALRRRIHQLLGQRGLPRDKVLAAAVRVLDLAGVRIGNPQYARSNGSYGLTTLKQRHLTIRGQQVSICFRGKSGIQHCTQMDDPKLARVLRKCSELPGQRLFQYLDDEGNEHPVESTDVNAAIQKWTGTSMTAKDFRTWAGTVAFVEAISAADEPAVATLQELLQYVAGYLGNTTAICRKYYIHPAIIEDWLSGQLPQRIQSLPVPNRPSGLQAAERLTLQLLKVLRPQTSRTSRSSGRRGQSRRITAPAA